MQILSQTVTARRVLQGAVAVGLVAGMTTAGVPAQAASERVLQNVAVTLDPGSSITGITSTAVRADGSDDLTTDTEELSPSEVAGDLPVRILTQYRLDDRSGTDLSEIEGESGRVVIDVVVQNITAHPEQLAFDFNGRKVEQYALVATPMTVVGSAKVGEEEFGSIVTRDDVDPEAVTNGVVGKTGKRSQTQSGDADVQWAALLAPPRLGASATFRLVMDTEDFKVPTFDFSIQPGLVTDSSVQRLLEAAFAEDPSSTLALETKTIELVGEVNTTLTGASAVLASIQSELGSSASTLGAKTIADLQTSSQHVTSALTGLSQDLEALDQTMATEMRSANAETVAQFNQTVQEMQDLLGDPGSLAQSPSVQPVGCQEQLPKIDLRSSISQQMLAISRHLKAISSAAGDCKVQIVDGLQRSIGDPSTTQDECLATGDSSVMCTLNATQAGIGQQVEAIKTAGAALAGRVDSQLLTNLQTSVGDVVGKVQVVVDAAKRVNSNNNNQLLATLVAMDDELEAAQTELAGLSADAGTVSTQLDLAQDALGDSAEIQVTEAATSVCAAYPSANDPAKLALDRASVLLVGHTCADPATDVAPVGYSDDLAARLDAANTAIDAAIDASDELAPAIKNVGTRVQKARDQISSILDPGGSNSTKAPIQALMDAVNALSPYRPQAWSSCSDMPSETSTDPKDVKEIEAIKSNPSQLLQYRFQTLMCLQYGLDSEITQYFDEAAKYLEKTSAVLEQHKTDIGAARDTAVGQVDGLVGNLQGALGDAESSIRSQGRATLNDQQASLQQKKAQLSTQLDARVDEAVRRINAQVSSSVTDLRSSQTRLTSDLNEVLVDLGDRSNNGTGILGSLVKGAADTQTATGQVLDATQTASSFSNVRSEALRDVYLQQAQLARSLELQEMFPVFGIELPQGSTHLTVFTYHLES